MIFGHSIIDESTLTIGGTNEELLPGVAMLRPQPRDIWRSRTATGTDHAITIDQGAPTRPYNAVAMLYHNIKPSIEWRIRTATIEANLTAAPSYDSGTMALPDNDVEDRFSRYHAVKKLSATRQERYIRIDITSIADMTNVEIGRLMVINSMAPGAAYNFNYSIEEDAVFTPTAGGLWTQTGRKYRTVTWTVPDITEPTDGALAGYADQKLTSTPVVICLKEDESNYQTDWTFYGVIESVSNTYVLPNVSARTYTLIEMERP